MKKNILIVTLVFSTTVFLPAQGIGFFMELGTGYNFDENVGLGFLAKSKGLYVGAGAGYTFIPGKIVSDFVGGDYSSDWRLSLGVNIDFLIKPEISFTRGEEHYQVETIGDGTSLRILPYLQMSRSITDRFYIGFGLGYGWNNIYFGMRPLQYDHEYTSYQLSNNSVTPLLFIRMYLHHGLYLSFNYEADIVINGELERLAGDPLAGFKDIDGATDINGVHHRARLVIGYFLGS
jgi:hypothetical protein